MQQKVANIQTRRYLDRREENSRISWLARSLGSLIAGGYMVEKGQENPGLEYANSLAFDDIERLMLKEVEEQANAEDPAKGNKEGSYEKLLLMLGGSGAFQRDK